jgi:hypothetical protein
MKYSGASPLDFTSIFAFARGIEATFAILQVWKEMVFSPSAPSTRPHRRAFSCPSQSAFSRKDIRMPTTSEAVDAIVRHIGFDPPRAKAVARSLTEDGAIPSGAPGRSPELAIDHVLDLVLGCAVDAPLRAIAATVERYRALTPGGANLDGAPAGIDRTAGDAIDIWADVALHGDGDLLRRDTIDVVAGWPEIAIHTGDTVSRFVAPGTLATHWQACGHRKSTTISGAALVDCLRELFPNGEK